MHPTSLSILNQLVITVPFKINTDAFYTKSVLDSYSTLLIFTISAHIESLKQATWNENAVDKSLRNPTNSVID